MKKVSLLAASVAIALTGCGGSDSGSGSNGNVAPGGVIVTGFDGYFNQAVVFLDKDNNGKLDIGSDTIFGLTDKEGRRTIPAGTQGVLALQTLTPGGTVQTALANHAPETYAGKYTIDMDHPTQAMAHEVVLRTLPGEKIISPLTDLVVVQAGANPTKEKIEEAKTEVNETLGITGNIAFTDVIAAKNHALHKTAQILTESKVNAGVNYTAENALKIAQEANKIVTAPENQDKLDQPNFKPTVEVTPSGDVQVTVNNKLIVNKSVADNIRSQLNTPLASHSLNLTLELAVGQEALFSDADNNNIALDVQVIDPIDNQAVKGLTVNASNGGTLSIVGDLTPVRAAYILKVTGTDINENKNAVGKVSTTFTFAIETPNSAPTIVPKIAEDLQAWIGSIELTQGVAVTDEQYRIDNLFADVDGDELIIEASSTIKELELSVIAVGSTKELKIAGTPTNTYSAGETITISAFDGIERTSKSFVLKQVDAKPIASFEVNTNALANLQSEITSQLVDLKVNEPLPSVQLSITLDDIFKAVNAHGPVEYFAGMKGENQDHNTSVAGIKVAVDNMGVLTISGTPLEASTDGEFYIAAGIYPDAEDGVISEMTRIALPEVKAADTTPPPVSLGFTKEHFNNQQWVMGSFADRDGEIGYASLMNNNGSFEWCWGDQEREGDQVFKSNISNYNGAPDPINTLRALNKVSGYVESTNKDCWPVTLNNDGTLTAHHNDMGVETNWNYEMLYQNIRDGQYQIIVKINNQELFWLDSASTPLDQTLAVNTQIAEGKVEYYMSVEGDGQHHEELDGPRLSYSYGKREYQANNQYHDNSILPEGFDTPGTWQSVKDMDGLERAELEEEREDQKTRVRYVHRDFGDFYIGITWSKEVNGYESPAQYSLFSHNQEAMDKLVKAMPLMTN
ncbi:hypothetical protein LA284_003078 [Vibrio vulnificus]|nr:hypothetical protein [Vibrio vulnificus]EID0717973.1 hypothetical protein [Vibrio vulnificus]EID0741776.1 hypothetical protein [Vibrio vulnificus]EJL7819138.1 hypothetical protein [Vibrio vulnificus]